MIYRELDAVVVIKGRRYGQGGAVVIADPERDWYEVEFVDPDGLASEFGTYRGHELKRAAR